MVKTENEPQENERSSLPSADDDDADADNPDAVALTTTTEVNVKDTTSAASGTTISKYAEIDDKLVAAANVGVGGSTATTSSSDKKKSPDLHTKDTATLERYVAMQMQGNVPPPPSAASRSSGREAASSQTPGAYAVLAPRGPTTTAPSQREAVVVVTTETHPEHDEGTPATEEPQEELVSAEIATDVEALTEERDALRQQLERLQEQQQQQQDTTTVQEVVLAEPVAQPEGTKDEDISSSSAGSTTRQRLLLTAAVGILILLVVGISLGVALPRQDDSNNQVPDSIDMDAGENSTEEMALTVVDPQLQLADQDMSMNLGSGYTPVSLNEINTTTPRFLNLYSMLEPLYGADTLKQEHRQQAMHWLANVDTTTPITQSQQNNTSLLLSTSLHQRYIMALLYIATQGWFWGLKDNWLSPFPTCSWESIHCDEPTESVLVELELARNNLQGTVPNELGMLTQLTRSGLAYNALTGTIPTQYGLLTLLEDVSFGTNKMTGTLPSQIGNWNNLWFFSCTGNRLTGTIPTQLGRLQKLENLYIGENFFSGTLPTEMQQLTLLENFHFHMNYDLWGDANPIACHSDTINSGADCLANIDCDCCEFCCNTTTCCVYNNNNEGEGQQQGEEQQQQNVLCKPHPE